MKTKSRPRLYLETTQGWPKDHPNHVKNAQNEYYTKDRVKLLKILVVKYRDKGGYGLSERLVHLVDKAVDVSLSKTLLVLSGKLLLFIEWTFSEENVP